MVVKVHKDQCPFLTSHLTVKESISDDIQHVGICGKAGLKNKTCNLFGRKVEYRSEEN